MADMNGQVALVTGGIRGIGLAIGERLMNRGVRVAAGYSSHRDDAQLFADKYADHGTAQFTIPDVFEVPPISQHGNLKEIAAKFGGTDKLMDAVDRLQTLLYAA